MGKHSSFFTLLKTVYHVPAACLALNLTPILLPEGGEPTRRLYAINLSKAHPDYILYAGYKRNRVASPDGHGVPSSFDSNWDPRNWTRAEKNLKP